MQSTYLVHYERNPGFPPGAVRPRPSVRRTWTDGKRRNIRAQSTARRTESRVQRENKNPKNWQNKRSRI